MRGAAEALKLDPDCSHDELKVALESVLKKIAAADTIVAETREQTKQQIAALEKQLAAATKAQQIAQTQATESQKAQENSLQEIAVERAATANEIKKLKERVAEREKEIKAINTALSDTPENEIGRAHV